MYKNNEAETNFKITFNNENYNTNSKPPFRHKKQTTLDQYWTPNENQYQDIRNKNRSNISQPTILLNWKICRYLTKLNGKTIHSHYIDGDLKSGKGWTTSDIVNITIKNRYLDISTFSRSIYRLYLDQGLSEEWCDRTVNLY